MFHTEPEFIDITPEMRERLESMLGIFHGTAPDRLFVFCNIDFRRVDEPDFGARTADGHYLVCDAAPIGPDYLPGHAHGDLLSFELSLGGHRVFVDSGVESYEADELRRYCRSTRAHNTVELDGADIAPTVTWGINPGQATGVDEPIRALSEVPDDERASIEEALAIGLLTERVADAAHRAAAAGVEIVPCVT